MQEIGRLLTLVIVLALGLGPFAAALASPPPVQPTAMADEMHASMAGMDASTGDCAPCTDKPGVMEDCLPTCASMPGFAHQDSVRLALGRANYESRLEQSFSGVQSRPDPYPPRPIILS